MPFKIYDNKIQFISLNKLLIENKILDNFSKTLPNFFLDSLNNEGNNLRFGVGSRYYSDFKLSLFYTGLESALNNKLNQDFVVEGILIPNHPICKMNYSGKNSIQIDENGMTLFLPLSNNLSCNLQFLSYDFVGRLDSINPKVEILFRP